MMYQVCSNDDPGKTFDQFSQDFTWGLLSKGLLQFVQMVLHN